MPERVKLAITMGDPAGIGPEIIVKALARQSIYEQSIPVVIGDYEALRDACDFCNSDLTLREIKDMSEANGEFGFLEYINLGYLEPGSWEYKKCTALCGDASFHYIIYGIQTALANQADAVITAPISKESLHMAGHKYSGHTEIFAEYTGTKDYAMLLASDQLRVIHVTTHCALREACILIKKERILKVIMMAEQGMKDMGINSPRIAVAGLNPHNSENGLFGTEERDEIIPAVREAQSMGICVEGPLPPDTIFTKCVAGMYDIAVAMYHDQGHIPLKLHGFRMNPLTGDFESVKGINCTVGLPIIRASVDHGTAYGKAGEGRANEDSMLDAIFAGIQMAESKRKRADRK